jgi:hypothetical protein
VDVLRAALAVIHSSVAAVWLGAMLYSLVVVQPRAQAFFGSAGARYEDFATALAAGARWKVLGMAFVLAVSGGGLVAVEIDAAHDPSALWVALVVAKGVLLLAVVAIFARVSWTLWPRRLFASAAELPAIQRRFRAFALAMTALVGAAFALGAIAGSVR